MPDNYISDKRLSLKAKGLLTILIECEAEISSDLSKVCAFTGDKDVTVNSAFSELVKYGYIVYLNEMRGDTIKALGFKAFAYAQA